MNRKNKVTLFSVLILVLLIFCSTPARTVAQTHAGLTEKLSVGVAEFPPYSLKTEKGQWKGLAIELWQAVARELGVAYEFREYNRIKQITGAIQAGDVDVIPAVDVNAQNEKLMDLSHAFYQSGLGIAKSRDRHGLGWFTYFKAFNIYEHPTGYIHPVLRGADSRNLCLDFREQKESCHVRWKLLTRSRPKPLVVDRHHDHRRLWR